MNQTARYRYNLRTRQNEWIDYDHSQIFGWSQDEINAMGNRVLERIVHPDDLHAVNFYHRRLKFLTPDDGHDQIFCRCYTKSGITPLFVRFVDRCVEVGPDGTCTTIEGEATVLPQAEFDARKRLEHGIKSGEFGFHYQPVCSLQTGEVVGYEALARWFRGDDIIGPGVFLPIVEGSSLERHWIASQVQVLIKALDRLPSPLWLSYNLSQDALESGNAIPCIPLMRAQRIHVEILESVQIQTERALAQLKFIKTCGHPLYVDDLGQGLSLPTILSGLPVDGVKLDRILTEGIPHNESICQLVAGILEWTNGRELETVAEWVGTPEQVDWLLGHGCDYGQGSLYGLAGELPY